MSSRPRRLWANRIVAVSLLALTGGLSPATSAKVNVGADGVAIHGYDTVGYFLEGRAVRGTSEFEHAWNDAKWRFSSETNMKLFVSDPTRYAPQYGGYCAVCLALDSKLTDANPKAWTIIDGKLYLNYSMHQRTQWRIRANTYVVFGDQEWRKVLRREQGSKGREGYRIAVLNPGFHYAGRPWGEGTSALDDVFLSVSGGIYRAIQEQSSVSISFADEPPDSSARSEVNRAGDWPFPETNVDRKVVWELESDRQHMAPNLEQVYRAGRELGVDGVVMYYLKPVWQKPQWPVEVYVIDIGHQRVYQHKGNNTEASTLVKQAFSEFVAARKQ